MGDITAPAGRLSLDADGVDEKARVNGSWERSLRNYDEEFRNGRLEISRLLKSLVGQLLVGCGNSECRNDKCATGIRNTSYVPVRQYTPRSARILAFELLNHPNPEAHVCLHYNPSAHVDAVPDGPRDPTSFMQRLATSTAMKSLADGKEPPDFTPPTYRGYPHVPAITFELEACCAPPLDTTGLTNGRFVPNERVANKIAVALDLFYDLLPKEGDQAVWRSLAHHINNGQASSPQTLSPRDDNQVLIGLLRFFEFDPYVRLCAQVCKVIALRTQVEDVAARFREVEAGGSGTDNVLSLLAERVTGIARERTTNKKDAWIPWPYPLWFKKTFLKHWDGKFVVPRGSIASGALELLEMQQKIWDRSHPDKTSDANLLPFIYKRLDATEMIQSWVTHESTATTKSRHLLSFPFLFSDGQMMMYFRTLNHLRMREAYKDSHVNEELYDRHIASSDSASLEWDNNAHETQHLRDFYLLLTVRRDNIIQDAFDQLWQRRQCELLRPLRVRLGEMEGAEVGQDLGGVQIEFFNLVCKALFAEDAGMFATDAITGLSYFRPGSLQPLYMFKLFGLLVALAAYNGITIPVSFPLAFYKHLLDIPCEDIRDVQDGWPDIARSLQSIRDGAHEGLEYVFPLEANGLRLSINHTALKYLRSQFDEYKSGVRTALQLQASEMSRIDVPVPSSSRMPDQVANHKWPGWSILAPEFLVDVAQETNANEQGLGTSHAQSTDTAALNDQQSVDLTASTATPYTADYASFLTTLSVLPQLTAFKHGFHTLLPTPKISLFTPRTLKAALEGSSTLDVAALRRATQYKDYLPTDPYIKSFWRVLQSWPSEKQKALLKFVTAAERVPITGVGMLTFRIQRGEGGELGLLPTSSTCFGTLYLPRYRDEETLEGKLGVALEFGGEGFGTA